MNKDRLPADASQDSCSAGEIRQQLRSILGSPDFDATTQQRAFLEFVVSQSLAGKDRDIKGYTIATQVFGRDENFDQAIDPIVSIQANRLRRSLERYYLLSGKNDPVHIDIPKGRYVPVFKKRNSFTSSPALRRSKDQATSLVQTWPTLVIKPFQNLTNKPEKNFWGAGFAAELAAEICRIHWIWVLCYGSEGRSRRSSDTGARFVIEGSFREDEDGIKVLVTLIDAKANRHIWADNQRFDTSATPLIAFQERVASVVGSTVAGEQGIINLTLAGEAKKKQPAQLQTYEAILRYHEYDQTLLPEDFVRAFEALEHARINEPECGQVCSFLARLHANIFSLEIPGFDITDSENTALSYAENGVRLIPSDQRARGVLAFVKMLSGDIAAARREIDLAYDLHPNSLYLLDGIGYIMTLLGDWEHGPALIRKSIKLNPFYKPIVHYGLWVDYLRQHDFQNAYLETSGLRRPAVFWYPLAKASTLGLLGRIAEGKNFARDLMELKPDFRERGRGLIGRYIKFEDIAESVIRGLAAVGVDVL